MKTGFAFQSNPQDVKALPFYLINTGTQENQLRIENPFGLENYFWLHCNKGSGTLILNNQKHTISENDGFLLYPGTPYKYYSPDMTWKTRFISFNGNSVAPLLKLLNICNRVYSLCDVSPLDKIMQDISIVTMSDNSLREFLSSQLIYSLLIQLKSCIEIDNPVINQAGVDYLKPVISYIQNNFNKKFTLSELAFILHITPQHLCRLFMKTYNMRPFEYITWSRLQNAKKLLISKQNYSIKQVAYLVGFNDTSYFSSIFKFYEGLTPTDFKKSSFYP